MQLGSIVSAGKAFGGTALSWATGAKFWLIAIAVVAVLSFGAGFYIGTTTIARINAHELATATEKARKTQADADQKKWAAAKRDYTARRKKNVAADVVYQMIYRDREKIIRVPEACRKAATIPADAMKRLNDPYLVGETK